jgi:hypothetical protein
MVRKMCDDGIHYYHEPPYTWEEEMAIYKGMDINGPVTILHGPRPASVVPSRPPGSRQKPEEQ